MDNFLENEDNEQNNFNIISYENQSYENINLMIS